MIQIRSEHDRDVAIQTAHFVLRNILFRLFLRLHQPRVPSQLISSIISCAACLLLLVPGLQLFAQIPFATNGLTAHFSFNGSRQTTYGGASPIKLAGDFDYVPDRFGRPHEAIALGQNHGTISLGGLNGNQPQSKKVTASIWVRWSGRFYNHPIENPNEHYAVLLNLGSSYLYFSKSNRFGIGDWTGRDQLWGITHDSSFINQWKHVVAVWASGDVQQCKLYVDGKPQLCTITTNGAPSSSSFNTSYDIFGYIGGDQYSTSSMRLRSFIGEVDDFRWYNRELSPTEIEYLHARETVFDSIDAAALVANYPLDGSMAEISRFSQTGVAIGALSSTNRFAQEGRALSLNGRSSQLRTPDSILDFCNDFTASLWFLVRSLSDIDQPLLAFVSSDGGLSIGMRSVPSFPLQAQLIVSLDSHSDNFSAPIAVGNSAKVFTNVWYKITVRKRLTTVSVFVNDVIDSEFTQGPVFDCSRGVVVGSDYWATSFFNGVVDDLILWQSAISDAEVAQSFNAESPVTMPQLSISTSAIRLALRLRPFVRYQLESSADGLLWSNLGESFVPSTVEYSVDFSVDATYRFFRAREVAP